MFDPGNCQLTIQMTRESLAAFKSQITRSEPMLLRDEDLKHRSRDSSCDSHQVQNVSGGVSSDTDLIQRRILALVPIDMTFTSILGDYKNEADICRAISSRHVYSRHEHA